MGNSAGLVIVAGGSTAGFAVNDVWSSANGGATWIQLSASSPWAGRYLFGFTFRTDSSLVILGGSGDSQSKNDIWRSFDHGATWHRVISAASWASRSSFDAVACEDGDLAIIA